ncbi:MAG: NTP transferase domain-containing protein [Eubacteriales bacterium]|nr:NTP transferase domain-containing protein [Eubacteriales bacterium]
MKTGALIIASLDFGRANRDSEDMAVFLPMQHLDGTTVIKREIFTLRKAGISPVMVLCGYQREVLKNHLSHNGVIFCEDEAFAEHGFAETLKVGMDFAAGLCERVLVVPVECPVFSSKTVETLMECEESTVPTYQGTPGKLWLHVFGGEPKTTSAEEEGVTLPGGFVSGREPKAALPEEEGVTLPGGFVSGREPKAAFLEEEGVALPGGFVSGRGPEAAFVEVEDAGILYSLTEENGIRKVQEYARRQREANALQVKLKVMLTKEEDFFGPGVYQLLRGIDETGSMQAAAAKMQMSYTKCWKMVNKVEAQMGFKFVNRVNGGRNGGNSTLTEEARDFLDRYRALTEDIRRMSRSFFDIYFQDFQ